MDTQFITDAINSTGMNSQAVVTWQKALNKLASQGKVEKVGTSPSNVDYSKLTPGDIIIFGNSSSSHVHAAIFAGVYNGKHFIIHVGNERGPEINTTEGIENNHPAIIDAGTFARVQEEIARRSGKPKVKQKGTKTELSRYSSKYALSELLICGECRTPYRRCTWTAKGKKKIVWRCINRLDYGKKYCHHSPSIEESLLQDAVMRAIMQTAKQNVEVLKTLKIHIGMGLTDEITEDKTLDIQIRIAEIDTEFQKMLKAVSADNADGIDEERITELMNEKQRLTVQLEQYAAMRQKRESAKSRLDEIYTILDGLQNHPMEYDDKLVRQIIECIVVESKEKIKVVFIGGTEIEMVL